MLTEASVLHDNERNKNIKGSPLGLPKPISGKVNCMTASVRTRRKPKGDTARAKAKRACERHLKDLRRAHEAPPANAAVSTRGLPKFVAPILEQSYCTSPAALCAELADLADLAEEAGE
jgi:hypothetical protein